MNNWIFVVTRQKDDGNWIQAREIFEIRMRDDFWGLNESTPNRKALAEGDRVVFYVGTREKKFAGSATLASPCYELDHEERLQLSHDRELFTADYGVRLLNTQIWDKPISAHDIIKSLSFVVNLPNWGSYFRGAIREISDLDYETLTSGQIPPKITAKISEPISGDKLYQERARAALPLLVRQAEAGVLVIYSDLAEELGMPNPRNLNFVLGSIGMSLECLSKAWKEKVPPIQCLVVNKNTGLPGEGIGWFLEDKEDFAALSLRVENAQLLKLSFSVFLPTENGQRFLRRFRLSKHSPTFRL